MRSGREAEDLHLRPLLHGLFGEGEDPVGDVIRGVVLAAVVADLGRDPLQDDRGLSPLESDGGLPRTQLAMPSPLP